MRLQCVTNGEIIASVRCAERPARVSASLQQKLPPLQVSVWMHGVFLRAGKCRCNEPVEVNDRQASSLFRLLARFFVSFVSRHARFGSTRSRPGMGYTRACRPQPAQEHAHVILKRLASRSRNSAAVWAPRVPNRERNTGDRRGIPPSGIAHRRGRRDSRSGRPSPSNLQADDPSRDALRGSAS